MKVFSQKVSGLLLLLISYILMTALLTVLPILGIIAQDSVSSYLVFGFMCTVGPLLFTNLLWLQLKTGQVIAIDTEKLLVTFYLNHTQRIPFETIFSIQGFLGHNHTVKVRYFHSGRRKYFFAHLGTVMLNNKPAFGELIEQILDNAVNIRQVEIDKFMEIHVGGRTAWGKSPDWTIINTAKRRAEENRKKLKPPETETQGTKESV